MRYTMNDLIWALRGMTGAGTADYAIGAFHYWSDDQIQNVLDRYRTDIIREPLVILQSYAGGGTPTYLYYQSEYNNYEETDGGTAIFQVQDGDGDNISSGDYSVDYSRGLVTFAADTEGETYYLTGRSYDLNSAAADVWRQKAAHYAQLFTFSTDNHRIDKGALIDNALKMARIYAANSPPVTTTLYRSDIDVTAIE